MRHLLLRQAPASTRLRACILWCERRELHAVSSRMATTHVHRMESCIRGYHVYHRIWYPTVGEKLNTICERENMHDRYAVAVLEEETCCVVGHLPHEVSRECYFFLRMGGTIAAEVTGKRRRSNLPEGGLEVPCVLTLQHDDEKIIDKAKLLLHNKTKAGQKMKKKK